MVDNVLAIPTRVADAKNNTTSGTRGTPDHDFDFLGAVTRDQQSKAGELSGEIQLGEFDLSNALNTFNADLKEARAKKFDNDT